MTNDCLLNNCQFSKETKDILQKGYCKSNLLQLNNLNLTMALVIVVVIVIIVVVVVIEVARYAHIDTILLI